MSHYSVEEWSDFVRNVSAADQRADMQAHLESGCRSCGATVKLWRGVLTSAQARVFEPRESAIRLVKATFAAQHRRKETPKVSRFARRIFDSVLHPSAVGLRASMAPMASRVRQLLYDAAPYVLDVRLEHEPRTQQVHLVGQIVYSSGTGLPLKDLTVTLMQGTDTLQQTLTNLFGEFHLEYRPDRDLILAVKIEQRESICIGLPDFTAPAEGVGA